MKKHIIYPVLCILHFTMIAQQTQQAIFQQFNYVPECVVTDITTEDSHKFINPSIIFPVSDCGPESDLDQDGILNQSDTDIDGDGLSNEIEDQYAHDMDGDGIPNKCDTDSDGDGFSDAIDACYSIFGNSGGGCSETQVFRSIFWLHGYQGNEQSLLKPGQDIENNFKIKSFYPDYNASQQSLESCAENVRRDILSATQGSVNTAHNIIIGHSMGGLVARKLGEMKNESGIPLYGGVITFGTPHMGAMAANTLVEHPEKIQNFITEACQSLSKGPATEQINNTGILGKMAVTFGFAGAVIDESCEAATGIGFPVITGFMQTGIEEELTTQGVINLPPLPTENKAAFVGIEEDDNESLTPRFMGALLYSANDFPLYTADEADGLGMALVDKELLFYNSKYEFWRKKKAPWWLWGPCPACALAEEIRYNTLAKAYKQGKDWFKILNPSWKNLIGALDVTLDQTGCQCDTYVQGELTDSQIYFGETDCDSFNSDFGTVQIQCQPHYELLNIHKPSDGFILCESAAQGPGINYEPVYMNGSNHMQMRNDSEMQKALLKIFDDGIDNRRFFQTDRR
jgi:hypothetical protein